MPDPSPKLLLHGLDSLCVSYFFIPGTSRIDWDDLAYHKELLKATSIFGHMKSIGALLTILDGRETPLSLDETLERLKAGLMLNHYHPTEWKGDLEDCRKCHVMGAC